MYIIWWKLDQICLERLCFPHSYFLYLLRCEVLHKNRRLVIRLMLLFLFLGGKFSSHSFSFDSV